MLPIVACQDIVAAQSVHESEKTETDLDDAAVLAISGHTRDVVVYRHPYIDLLQDRLFGRAMTFHN